MTIIRLPALLLLVLVVGCGFRLRGLAELPPALETVYIQTEEGLGPRNRLARTLTRVLEGSGATLVPRDQAGAVIHILGEGLNRRVVAVGNDGNAREYDLTYGVRYSVILADGTVLIPPQEMTVSRSLFYGEDQVLGREQGEALALGDMVTELARSILRRVRAETGGLS